MFIIYDVPDETQPQIKKFVIVCSKVNSSVYGEMHNKKAPTQNPIHIGQWKSSPKPLSHVFAGLILLKIEP
tara:strand:- start:64 stop:276 length:213 start_codon:yes stop_codon:yes gene_type:complete